jgi:hypothetical protein
VPAIRPRWGFIGIYDKNVVDAPRLIWVLLVDAACPSSKPTLPESGLLSPAIVDFLKLPRFWLSMVRNWYRSRMKGKMPILCTLAHRVMTYALLPVALGARRVWGSTDDKAAADRPGPAYAALSSIFSLRRDLEESFNPTRGTIEVIELIERNLAPSIDMKQTMRQAGLAQEYPVLDGYGDWLDAGFIAS